MNKISSYYWAYRNKISNKLFGRAFLPAQGTKKGSVLLSYLPESFTHTPKEGFSNLHTADFECFEIAKLFTLRGYDVDVIHFNDTSFIPRKPYAVCVDIHQNLARLAHLFPKDCKKVLHVVGSFWEFQNNAELQRLESLEKRRGFKLKPRRISPPSNNPEFADFMEGFGNERVHSTYKHFNKPIFRIPISTVQTFDFPLNKNWDKAKQHFLWFGGGGVVHKGLDLVLEAFAKTPNLNLHICGPLSAEKDFIEAYKKELFETPNIKMYGRIDPTATEFKNIIDMCASTIHLSSSEGTSGAVIQTMHAGLIPIITPETGIDSRASGILLEKPTVELIEKTIIDFSLTSSQKIRDMAYTAWNFTRINNTRKSFSNKYGEFIDTVLKL
jgi:glycosyltransferase involved in cell wall biosynthesis